jgi:hypothetical protein
VGSSNAVQRLWQAQGWSETLTRQSPCLGGDPSSRSRAADVLFREEPEDEEDEEDDGNEEDDEDKEDDEGYSE